MTTAGLIRISHPARLRRRLEDLTRWCFENWCLGLPASPADVGRYLEHLVETEGKSMSSATPSKRVVWNDIGQRHDGYVFCAAGRPKATTNRGNTSSQQH